MSTVASTAVRLRKFAGPNAAGEYDRATLDQIFNREIYPAIHAVNATVDQITVALNRFVPRFVSGPSNPILTTDENALIVVDHGSACELTFSAATADTFADGVCIAMMQYGAGQLTLTPTGITVQKPETLKTRKQFAISFISKLRDTEWFLIGDTELA